MLYRFISCYIFGVKGMKLCVTYVEGRGESCVCVWAASSMKLQASVSEHVVGVNITVKNLMCSVKRVC